MDKLAYHFNKKKIPAKSAGKYKYYYPCLLKEEADEQYGDNYYIVTEVSESEWESLLELDRLEYNNTHKFSRHSSMPDKNKTNLAKTPQFPRFLSNSRLKYGKYVCVRLCQKSSKISAFWLRASLTARF